MPLRFTFRQLEYFVAVGHAGSISRAAEQINISSPSISAAIAQLEQEFNVQLFVRQHAQGLSLTPAGRNFLHEAKLLLDQAERLHDLAADVGDRVSGPLSIGCLVTVAPSLLAPLRQRFETAYPDAEISQREAHQADLLAKLMRAEIDVAITYDLQIPSEIDFKPLVKLPPYAFFAEAHPQAASATVSLETLAEQPLVLLDLPFSRDYFLALFHDRGLKPTIAERTGDMGLMRSMVANGYGYGLANIKPAAAASLDGKPLVTRALEGSPRPMILGLATVRDIRKTAVLRAFEEHCRQGVDNDPAG